MPLTLDDFRRPPVLPSVSLSGTLGKVVFRHKEFSNGGEGWFAEATISDVTADPTTASVIAEALEEQRWEGTPEEAIAASYFRFKPAIYQGKGKPKVNLVVAPRMRDDDGAIEAWDPDKREFVQVTGIKAEEQEFYNVTAFLRKLRDVYRIAEAIVGELPSVEPLLDEINAASPSEAVKIFEEELLYATEGTPITFKVTQVRLDDGRVVNGVGSVIRES